MRIAVWKTGHEIADTVASTVYVGMCNSEYNAMLPYDANLHNIPELVSLFDVHIGYGILRGMADVFRECDRQGKPWFNIDRGYFNPGHFDGNYRISLCGTQQTIGLDKLESDGSRFAAFGIKFEDCWYNPNGHVLVVPPTVHAANFFNYNKTLWIADSIPIPNFVVREKGDHTPLDEHLKDCRQVITFNSSIGWEALRRGIQVNSDPIHSIVGSWQKMIDKPIHLDFNERHKLFGVMGDLQMTLEEIRNGHLCPLIEKMVNLYHQDKQQNTIYSLAGTAENR